MSIVFFTDPQSQSDWRTFFYGFLLSFLILAAFLFYRFLQNIRAIQHIHNESHENLSLEAAFYQQLMEDMEREHIRKLNHIQEKQKEYYDFITSWFHEIKTPISVLWLMQQTEIDAKSLREEVSKIEHYVDQALYYAKLDSFNQDYEIKNCHLERMVKELIKTHSKTFIAKKIRINLHVQPVIVQSDSKWLQFILNQLITNSLKYTEENGEITISTCETLKEKQLIIQDNGIGIEPKDLPRIFNRGFTGSNGRIHTKSTGIGLYLAQELSNKLGHYITCTSKLKSNTEFVVHFPKNYDAYLNMMK
ncbi:sensor histidine kinase [Sporosarcina globispora]|uniref:sensor histidine kinase n=1 Tax=Sporosarcina globispora TaxID=1459 RepID=UPI001F38AB4E|nr:sensor histidine kinase [Sporosarcina globispora]